MGLSASAAVIIILLGVAGALVIAYPVVESGIRGISGGLGEQGQIVSSAQQSSLQITGISVQGSCNKYNLTVVVNNTGSTQLAFRKLTVFDNNEVLQLKNATTTAKFYSSSSADGYIQFDGSSYTVYNTTNVSWIGRDRRGGDTYYRSYFSFDTSSLNDGADITDAELYLKVNETVSDTSVTWNVDYYYGFNAIGVLTQSAWNNFTYFATSNYLGTVGWKNMSVPKSDINRQGDTDFELRSNWDPGNNNYAIARPWQTESFGRENDPYLVVTYSHSNLSALTIAPAKNINIVFYDMSSSSEEHAVSVVTENGATARATYDCS
ncbi:MAG: hypothetical protein ABIF01_02310 [Candidatus Micrarchaeota archaeon]